ncbi:phosphatidylinositol kinase- protein kinase tor1 [Coemansia sp. IMI 209127]|nr:phosphatidylinositol kinase- protein kinase tor1 [Coemansia sp. IMI 209127]
MQKTRIVNQLKSLYSGGSDSAVCAEAVVLYGRLVKRKWPVVMSSIKPELDRCLEWLSAERDMVRQTTALRLIQVLCNGASTTMYLYILNIINSLKAPLRSHLLEMRETAATTLEIGLELVSLHEKSARDILLDNMYQELLYNHGVGSVEGYHSSLLLCRVMLLHGGEYMETHYSTVSGMILALKKHPNPTVRGAAIGLLPILARFSPNRFAELDIDGKTIMSTVCNHLIEVTQGSNKDGWAAFLALANIAQSCSSDFQPFLEPTARSIEKALINYAKSPQPPQAHGPEKAPSAILETIAILASAMGADLARHMHGILDLMFVAGLNNELCDSLSALLLNVSQLRQAVHERLLDMISIILVDVPFRADEPAIDAIKKRLGLVSLHHTIPTLRSSGSSNNGNNRSGNDGDAQGEREAISVKDIAKDIPVTREILVFALQTLARFDFSDENLSEFVRNAVLRYVGNSSAAVRKAAIQSAFKILLSDPMYIQTEGSGTEVASEVVERLIAVAVTDLDSSVRLVAAQTLAQGPALDFHLSKEQNIKSLLLLVNDEVFEMRLTVLSIIGRVAAINPGNTVPSIRRIASQLLMELEFANTSSEHEESIQLLMELTNVAEQWMKPCVDDIFLAILPRINSSPPRLASKFLDMVAALARVGGSEIVSNSSQLLSKIVSILNNQDSGPVCLSALRALGSCASYCGMAIDPYLEYPRLFGTLTGILRSQHNSEVRNEVVRVIGALGAIDPHKYKGIADTHPGAQRGNNNNNNEINATIAHAHTHANANVGEGAGGGSVSVNAVPGSKSNGAFSLANGAQTNIRQSKKRGKAKRTRRRLQEHKEPAPNVVTLLIDDDSPAALAGDIPTNLNGRQFTNDRHYTEVAMDVLIRILDSTADTSSDQYAVQALLHMCAPLRASCSPYLHLIIPAILRAMKASPLQRPMFFIQQLTRLVNIAGELIRPHADSLFELIDRDSSTSDQHTLSLIGLAEALGNVLYGQFGAHMTRVLQFLMAAVEEDTSDSLQVTQSVFGVLGILSLSLDSYLQLVMPRLVYMLDPKKAPVAIIGKCLDCISLIVSVIDCSSFASRIVLPLVRLLQNRNAQSLQGSVLDTLCGLMEQLQADFVLYMPTIDAILKKHNIPAHDRYQGYSKLLFADKLVPVAPFVRVRSSSTGNQPDKSYDMPSLHVDVAILQRAWTTRSQMTGDDCIQWLNYLFSELLQQSPSSSLRACYNLALKNPKLIGELFNVAFVSCWADLSTHHQPELVKSMEGVASNPDVPLEFLQTILDLAGFMERDGKQLPIDVKVLSDYAARCHALAKEIRYRETEWTLERNDEAVERLMELNQDLDMDDEAIGLLNHVRKDRSSTKDSTEWCIRLQRWDEALAMYKQQAVQSGPSHSNMVGQIRCLFEMSDWNALIPIYERIWRGEDKALQVQSAEIGVKLAWSVGDIERMEFYLSKTQSTDMATSLDRALLCVHQNRFDDASKHISDCRDKLGHALDTHLTEFYRQGYSQVFHSQMLAELEEVIAFKLSSYDTERQTALVSTWKQRLEGIQRDPGMWQKLLSIHSMVLRPVMDMDTWIGYVNLCRSSGKLNMARNAICLMLDDEARYMEEVFHDHTTSGQSADTKTRAQEYMSLKERYDVNQSDISLNTAIRLSQQPALVYSYLKYKWAARERRDAFQLLESFIREYSSKAGFDPRKFENFSDHTEARKFIATGGDDTTAYFLARFYFKHAEWLSIVQQDASLKQSVVHGSRLGLDRGGDGLRAPRVNVSGSSGAPNNGTTNVNTGSGKGRPSKADRLDDDTDFLFRVRGERIDGLILDSYRAATVLDNKWYKAWHSLALRHYLETQREDAEKASVSNRTIDTHVVPAVHGFLRSIQLSRGDTAMQDALRLLTAWFNYSQHEGVVQMVQEGLDSVPMKTWLQVIPQILACIHIKHEGTNRLIRQLLTKIGRAHPQSILFSLYVTARSSHEERSLAAKDVLAKLHSVYPEHVEEAEVVSRELVRAAYLLPELWLAALTRVSNESNRHRDKARAIRLLKPLHDRMRALCTPNEREVALVVGSDISAAEQLVNRYFAAAPHNRNMEWINKAWALYARIQTKLTQMVYQVRKLRMREVAPMLLQCQSMHLAVPGSYHPDMEEVQIESFCAEMTVYPSKQKPRIMHVCGSNGKKYKFLLKGNEELRQDERAMQLFGLINSLLMRDEATSQRSLAIERFPVIPLSSDTGLIGFYPNCENMCVVVQKYREAHRKSLMAEQDLALQFAPNYPALTAMQQTEAFEYVLSNMSGDDLQWAMWYKSPSAEVWMQERTNYTRSMAVMSMAGYVLGLGDRHLSNIMIHSKSGKVVHIDFGDCFEVAAYRSEYPERVPFRLTRMTILPMGVNKTEGSFRLTANHMMRVLRANRDSLMAVLEAFVFDPLSLWSFIQDSGDAEGIRTQQEPQPQEDGALQAGDLKARAVVKRIQDKLTGRDFSPSVALAVEEQVDRLVQQAMCSENLAPLFWGWQPFW